MFGLWIEDKLLALGQDRGIDVLGSREGIPKEGSVPSS
jgi:hypothetical protein